MNSSTNNSKKEPKDKKIILNVAEANSSDVGRRIARIDPKISEEQGFLSGDVLELSSTTDLSISKRGQYIENKWKKERVENI